MKKLIAFLMILCILTACQTRETYVSDFTNFIEKVKANAENYTEQDWEKADKQFATFSEELYNKYETELTTEEKTEVLKLTASYGAIKVKSGVKNAAKKINDALNKLSGKE